MANNALAYGFTQFARIAGERVANVGERVVFDAIQESAREHTSAVNAMLASLVKTTTEHKLIFKQPGTGTLQPLDESGNPIAVVDAGSYTVAFPIQGGGTAFATNRVSRAMMTVEEANRMTIEAMKRDGDWVYRHALAAILDNTSWTYTDPTYSSQTIQPLANADGVLFNLRGLAAAADDNHYLATASAIADAANPYPTIYTELMEHPSNNGPLVCYIATNLKATTQALTNFVEVTDPDIMVGVASDRIVGNIDAVRGPGTEVLGKVDKCWIVEWNILPDSYLIAHAQGAGPVLGMREYPAAGLQGFFAEDGGGAGNITQTNMIRYAGFGALDRTAALVYYIGVSGTYAIPTNFDTPRPV